MVSGSVYRAAGDGPAIAARERTGESGAISRRSRPGGRTPSSSKDSQRDKAAQSRLRPPPHTPRPDERGESATPNRTKAKAVGRRPRPPQAIRSKAA